MANPNREDHRLRRLSSLCLALPEAEHTRCGAHADFRIRGKIFAYYLRNYQDDGITAVCFKGGFGEHIERVKRDPNRCYLPRGISLRGWFGLRLDQGEIDWDEIATLAARSYDLVAPPELRKPLPQLPPQTRAALTGRPAQAPDAGPAAAVTSSSPPSSRRSFGVSSPPA